MLPQFQYCRYEIILFVFILSGCSWTESALHTSAKANSEKAYVYGKFALQRAEPVEADSISIALQLTYIMEPRFTIEKYIEFKEKNNIYVVELPPGIYKIGKIAFFKDGIVHTEKDPPNMFSNATVTVEPGKAYYIGDYSGWTKKTPPQEWVINYSWQFNNLIDQFDKTTDIFMKHYPNFASVNKTNLFNSITQPAYSGIRDELLMADRYISEKEYDKAASILRRYAYGGVSSAQLKYGQMYANGLGRKPSQLAAAKWFKRSADLGNTDAMLLLGQLILAHSPTEESNPKFANWQSLGGRNQAIGLIDRSASRGNIKAMVTKCTLSSVENIDAEALAKNYAYCEVGLQQVKEHRKELRDILLKRKQSAHNKMDKRALRMAKNYVVLFKSGLLKP